MEIWNVKCVQYLIHCKYGLAVGNQHRCVVSSWKKSTTVSYIVASCTVNLIEQCRVISLTRSRGMSICWCDQSWRNFVTEFIYDKTGIGRIGSNFNALCRQAYFGDSVYRDCLLGSVLCQTFEEPQQDENCTRYLPSYVIVCPSFRLSTACQ